jgi:peroxiredoxin
MFQWGKHLGAEKVKLLPDGSTDFTRAKWIKRAPRDWISAEF